MSEAENLNRANDKVILFAASALVMPSLQMLLQQRRLVGVVLPEQADHFSCQLEAWLQQNRCPYLRLNSAQPELASQQIVLWQVDAAFSFSFPETQLAECVHNIRFGTYHFQPACQLHYNGAQPLYWLIRNIQSQTQLSLRKSDVALAKPDIALSQNLKIHPLETLQSLQGKVAEQAALMITQLLEQLIARQGKADLQHPQTIHAAGCKADAVTESDLYVDWENMSSQQIAALARAGNEQFGGCIVTLGNTALSLLQATEVAHPTYGVEPGTICLIGEPEGMIVASADAAVRLDILSNADGIFSGLSFAERFAVNAGMKFSGANKSAVTKFNNS